MKPDTRSWYLNPCSGPSTTSSVIWTKLSTCTRPRPGRISRPRAIRIGGPRRSQPVPVPEAPDGIAIIGFDPLRGMLLQHYFDSRGIARIYEMILGNGVWKLERTKEDFSRLDFSQRYTGRFKDDGKVIEGTWEISHDHSRWEKDFDLAYTRVG